MYMKADVLTLSLSVELLEHTFIFTLLLSLL